MIPRLTWRLVNVPDALDREAVRRTVQRSLDAWSKVCAITWAHEPLASRVDIAFTFRSIARAQYGSARAVCIPQNDGTHVIIFGTHVKWKAWSPGLFGYLSRVFAGGGVDAQDLLTFAIHEVGHALGLQHSEDELSVMFQQPEASGLKSNVTAADAVFARTLHGSP